MLEPIIKLLTVEECGICAEQNFLICDGCWREFFFPTHPVCYSCSARADDYSTCKSCRRKSVKPRHVWSSVRYDGEAKRLIYRMKFDSNRDIARLIAAKLTEVAPLISFDLVTYVPSSPKRIRQRGYDHAKLIASEFAKLRNLKFAKTLKRVGNSRQVGKSRAERHIQAENSYELIKQIPKPDHVLLMDDVVSTGATIEACTKLLRRAGIKKVDAACFAKR